MEFQSSQLDNGFTVITDYIPDAKAASIHWTLRSGSRHDDVHGTAHFFEHLIASSSTSTGRELFRRLQEITLARGLATGSENICGYADSLPEYIPELILSFGHCVSQPVWTPDAFKREQKRIVSEFKEKENDPSQKSLSESLSKPYHDHAVAHTALGPLENITAMTNLHLYNYHRDHFHAQRMGLVFSGPICHATILEHAQKGFGKLPRGTEPPTQTTPIFQTQNLYQFSRQEGGQASNIIFEGAYLSREFEYATYRMLWLYGIALEELFNDKAYSYSAPGASNYSFSDYGQSLIYFSVEPEHTNDALMDAMLLAATPEKWLTKERFEETGLNNRMRSARNALNPDARARTISSTFEGRAAALPYEDIIKNPESVTFSDVRKAYDLWDRSRFNITTCGPATDVLTPDQLLERLNAQQSYTAAPPLGPLPEPGH